MPEKMQITKTWLYLIILMTLYLRKAAAWIQQKQNQKQGLLTRAKIRKDSMDSFREWQLQKCNVWVYQDKNNAIAGKVLKELQEKIKTRTDSHCLGDVTLMSLEAFECELNKISVFTATQIKKEKKYAWCTVPARGNLGYETVLTVTAKGGNGALVVVPVEKFFTTLKSLHENAGHARITTMWKKVTAQYAGLPKSAVIKFLEGCIGCQSRATQINEAEPQQIVASEVFSIVQVGLIDMTMKPSAEFKYIVHLVDVFSNFHLVSPLERKTASGVNSVLTRMFGTIGLPHTVQTDNGKEFAQIADIFKDWPGGSDVRIIHGRPRDPQSQRLVEMGHQLIQDKLAIAETAWHRIHEAPFLWHERLPVIQYQINSAHSAFINNTPYEVVFRRQPKPTPTFGRDETIIEDGEQEIPDHSYSTAYESEQSIREGRNVVVYYDSQAGTAEEFAGRLANDCDSYGMKGMVMDSVECDMVDDVQQGASSQNTVLTVNASQTELLVRLLKLTKDINKVDAETMINLLSGGNKHSV